MMNTSETACLALDATVFPLLFGGNHILVIFAQNIHQKLFFSGSKCNICLLGRGNNTIIYKPTNKLLYDSYASSIKLGVFMFLLNNNELPHIFNSMFARNSTFIIIPHDSLDHFTYQGSEHFLQITFFTFAGPKLWNSLPPNLTRLKSIHSFITVFKT